MSWSREAGSGRIAFWQSAQTFPRVSFPSSVVRSIMLMTSFRPHTFDSFFSDRFASEAARSSAATASTPWAISRASPRLRRKTAGVKIGVDATRDSLIEPITLAPFPFAVVRSPFSGPTALRERRTDNEERLVRDAPALTDRIENPDLPFGRVVCPQVRQEMSGVAAEHHHLVTRHIVGNAAVLTRGRRVLSGDLLPRAAVPLPHVV